MPRKPTVAEGRKAGGGELHRLFFSQKRCVSFQTRDRGNLVHDSPRLYIWQASKQKKKKKKSDPRGGGEVLNPLTLPSPCTRLQQYQ